MNRKNLPDKGNYCLIISVDNNCSIKVGARGEISFKKGYYVYVGSALGSLSGRIKRHISVDKKKHWHIDYLLLDKNTKLEQIIYTSCIEKIECDIASIINKGSVNNIEGFGCSDCNCVSHLYYFKTYDDAENSSVDSYKKIDYKPYRWM